jgi:hypothetical protein
MKLSSFEKLASILNDTLRVQKLNDRRGWAITPDLLVFSTIRWLAGGSYCDIVALCGISPSIFYKRKDDVIAAITTSNNPILDNINFPQTAEECAVAAKGFEDKSYARAIRNVVSVHDGYLARTETPSIKDVGNVRSYFNGHYQSYGVNIQASCDSECRFSFIGVAGPGVMPDRDAINQVRLGQLIESLPYGYCSVGDPAYTASDRLVALFYGDAAKKCENDNFNYYASQLRIRIEMAFGLMQQKWGILWKPVRYPITKMKYLVIAIARLHNFCINERLARHATNEEATNDSSLAHIPSQLHERNGTPLDDEEADQHGYATTAISPRGHSTTRVNMVKHIRLLGLLRPLRSKLAGRATK